MTKGNIYANQINSIGEPVSDSYEVLSSIDYSQGIKFDENLNLEIGAAVSNRDEDEHEKGPPIVVVKLGSRESSSEHFS